MKDVDLFRFFNRLHKTKRRAHAATLQTLLRSGSVGTVYSGVYPADKSIMLMLSQHFKAL